MREEFAATIKQLRKKEMKITQTALLARIKKATVCHSYKKPDVSKWEHGIYRPNANVVDAMEDIFGLPAGYLLELADYDLEAEAKRQEVVLEKLKKYIQDEIKILAAANGLSYTDVDTGQLVEPSMKDRIAVYDRMPNPLGDDNKNRGNISNSD